MKNRPAGIKVLTMLYIFSGLVGLGLAALSLLGDGPSNKGLWATGGVALALLSFGLSWGLWRLRPAARWLATVVNGLAALGQAGLGLLFLLDAGAGLAENLDELSGSTLASDFPGAIAFFLFVGAAVDGFFVYYLTREPVHEPFKALKKHALLPSTQPSAQPSSGLSLRSASVRASFQVDQTKLAKQGAWLIVRSGPKSGQWYPLNRERNTIGRDANRASIKVDDPQVSRQHAQFNFEHGHVQLYDLASTNGTFVNNRRVRKKTLHDGDVVRVGQTEFVFKQAGKDKS